MGVSTIFVGWIRIWICLFSLLGTLTNNHQFTLGALLFSLAISSTQAAPVEATNQTANTTTRKLTTLADFFGGGYGVSRTSLQWVSDSSDGTYVVQDGPTGSLAFANIVTGVKETFVDAADLGKLGGDYYDYFIQPSRDHVLFAANYTKQYRYSYFADYYVFNRASKTLVPLVEDQAGDIQYAGWNNKGDSIAFVRGNDLYLWTNGTVTRVTKDGGPDVFNGVPDWVYEEGGFSSPPHGGILGWIGIDSE